MLERPSRPAHRRGKRTLVIAAAALLPTMGVVAAAGASTPVQRAVASAHDRSIPMSYDRADVAALHERVLAEHRAELLAFYLVLADSREQTDHQRASRGEPRQALADGGDTSQYWRPTTGTLTQPFHPGHDGIDIGVPVGTPVLAAADGVVSFAGQQSGYGTHLEIRHSDGTVTTYSHLSQIDTTVGQKVKAGEQIAHSGNTGHSTGPHLHFEVHPAEGVKTDPLAWLRAHKAW